MKTSNAKLFNKIALVTTVVLAAGTGISAQAVSPQTAIMALSTQVVANCTISAADLSVSGYDTIVAHKNADFDNQSSLTVACTKDTSAEVTFNEGGNTSRKLKDLSGNLLDYELYTDQAGGAVWGSDKLSGKTIVGTGEDQIVPVYMRVSQGQNVPAGTYTDSVTATITF